MKPPCSPIPAAARLALLASVVLGGASAAVAREVSFNDDIRPILSDKCFHCHGPDARKRKADLRLDTFDGATAEGAVVPGDPAASEMIARITETDPDEIMPPPEAKLGSLTDDEIAALRAWITSGAAYSEHWAFVPVTAPELPETADPATGAPAHPIDALVSSRLAERGLALQPEATRETLIRRVTFDLTGLPPTPDEVAAFVADDAPGAYGRLVDRLLASPRFGERMAVDWLDLARYADTYGFQVDRDREVWPWRDWVIKAFNENLPYDQFVTWQLAGDLLENPTDEQVLATAFNRLHQQKVEGGSTEEEFRVEYVADRVHTFGTAFLGLTLECARCHDHKFDPVTQTEYFQLFAFFQNIDEAGLYSFFTPSVPTPTLLLMDDAAKGKVTELDAAIAAEEARAGTLERVVGGGEIGRFPFDEASPGANAVDAAKALAIQGANRIVPGREGAGTCVELTGDDPVKLPFGNFARWDPFSVALWLRTPDVKDRAVVFHRSQAWTDAGSRGYELLIEDGRLKWSLIHFWPGNAISIRAVDPVPVGEWTHVAVAYDGSSRADGLSLFVNGERVATEVVKDRLTKQITGGGGDNITIGERMRDRGFKGGRVDDFRVVAREIAAEEARLLRDGEPLEGAVGDAWAAHLAKLRELREQRGRLLDGVRELMVMRELPEPKKAFRLDRGSYDARAEEVSMAVPAFLPPLPEGAPVNRLGLARWLTARDHPLASRTAVNRFWQACFGRGLVKTAEDFGSQGERPEYRELLDWLAADFMDHGWDVKRLMRTIVTSRVYRQRSLADPGLMADDPENRLLARGPSHRLPAEMIRDQALAASGLLVEKLGGPSVKPYEIAESFKPSKPDQGEGLYRRSLYTYWKRTGPAPAMMAFDAVKRDVCVARRERTNTPLQALILLNGPQYVEAARVLAERLWRESGGDPDAVAARAFTALTSREPDARERGILRALFDEQLAAFREDPARLDAFFANGAAPRGEDVPAAEVAAAGVLVSALMNHDESVMKR